MPYRISQATQAAFKPILDAIRKNHALIEAIPDVLRARPGYRHDTAAQVPAIVLSYNPPMPFSAAAQAAKLSAATGVPVITEEASPHQQIVFAGMPSQSSDFENLLSPIPGAESFAPPRTGNYTPPDGPDAPHLNAVNEEMTLTISTSPDEGFPILREFLGKGATERITMGMYQFTAPHIYEALRAAMKEGDATLQITMHPVPEKIGGSGNKADDIYGPDLLQKLQREFGSRYHFAWTLVGKNGDFPSAYHIKVIVMDGKRLWLSSGNLQSSNQPPYDPINDPQDLPSSYLRSYNREHHVVIENETLAGTYEKFLNYDYERATANKQDFGVGPDLFVPLEAPGIEEFAPGATKYFPPLTVTRKINVQPLLTPDNYAENITRFISSAKKTIELQNQYINLNPSGDLDQFSALINALLERQQHGVTVRVICRDMMDQEKLDMLLALDFPRDCFRFMTNTHTKVIIIDGERVAVGSHNLSNDGAVSNRDASLIIEDKEIAQHCLEVFNFDWNNRANAHPAKRRPRVARDGEESFSGGMRVGWSDMFDDAPPVPRRSILAPMTPVAPAGGDAPHLESFGIQDGGEQVAINGINPKTGKPLMPPMSVSKMADAIRNNLEKPPVELSAAGSKMSVESFGLPAFLSAEPQEAGWAVIYPENAASIRAELKSLVDHRNKLVPSRICKELEYKSGESVRDFLKRYGVGLGDVNPTRVPYYLLLAGDPTQIPFEFQFLLELNYSVGRLSFEPGGYARYACSVIKHETVGTSRSRSVAFFAPKTDPATTLSLNNLVTPILNGADGIKPIADLTDFKTISLLNNDATKQNLSNLFQDGNIQFLFTAGHGMEYVNGDADQLANQGALLTQDWQGGPVSASQFFSAADVKDNFNVHGLIVFSFACFGAGTPQKNYFVQDLGSPPSDIAPASFVAALPKRLLSHPNGSALACIGHIERAWGCSIQPAGVGPQVTPFVDAIYNVAKGKCVGTAMKDFGDRCAMLSSELVEAMAPGADPIDDRTLVGRWLERNDARGYILLGDPAVRIRVS